MSNSSAYIDGIQAATIIIIISADGIEFVVGVKGDINQELASKHTSNRDSGLRGVEVGDRVQAELLSGG